MEIILEVIDWILRITGLGSIIIIIINLFIKDYEYMENVEMISHPTEEELNKCKVYQEYPNIENAIEKTLFYPINCKVKVLKLYEVKITNRGKIKKGKLVNKFKNIEPYRGILFNVTRGCAVPVDMLEWKIDYGYKASVPLDANGFNGNENERTIKYTYGIISKIRKLLMIK